MPFVKTGTAFVALCADPFRTAAASSTADHPHDTSESAPSRASGGVE
jgi:hypothetical protein